MLRERVIKEGGKKAWAGNNVSLHPMHWEDSHRCSCTANYVRSWQCQSRNILEEKAIRWSGQLASLANRFKKKRNIVEWDRSRVRAIGLERGGRERKREREERKSLRVYIHLISIDDHCFKMCGWTKRDIYIYISSLISRCRNKENMNGTKRWEIV